MKEKLFLDTNIILDIMLNRIPFNVAAANILELGYRNEVELYATSLSFANALYVTRKELTTSVAVAKLKELNTIIKVLPTSRGQRWIEHSPLKIRILRMPCNMRLQNHYPLIVLLPVTRNISVCHPSL